MSLMRCDGGHEAHARLALTRRVTMKTEDEVFLSAYLDGELDLDQRSAVESALLSNPALAERLRELTAVRDLVASLPRPSLQEDLSPVVLAQVSGPSAREPRRFPGAPIGLAAAALALVAFGLNLVSSSSRSPDPRRAQPAPIAARPVSPPVAPANSHRPTELHPTQPSFIQGPPISPPSAASHALAARVEEAERQADREQQRILELLDSPDLKHVFVVVDEIGGDLPDRVEGLVRHTPRLNPSFGKITVSQGIVIDPNHPNQATVFALVMDQNEIAQFRNRLKQDLPTPVEEKEADPTVVTQLSGIGQIAILSGTRATELATLPSDSTPKTASRVPQTPKNRAVMLQSSPEFDGLQVPVVVERRTPSPDHQAVIKSSAEHEATAATEPTSEGGTEPAPGVAKLDQPSEPAGSDEVTKPPGETRTRPTSIVLVWVTSRTPASVGSDPPPPTRR